MATAQTSYTEDHAQAYAGMIANPQTCDRDSREWEGTTAGKFGYACQQGTSAIQAKAGAAAGTILGVLAMDRTRQPSDDDEYKAGVMATVLFRGDIWVPVEAAVTVGQSVYADNTTGQLSSTSSGGTKIDGARWITAQATAGGLARVRLSGYQASG